MDSGARETLRQWIISKELADRIDREFDKIFPLSTPKSEVLNSTARFDQKALK